MHESLPTLRWTEVAAVAAPTLVASVWLGLTWHTGLTFHFMPLAVAASGAAAARWSSAFALTRAKAGAYAVWALFVLVLAWSTMVAGDFQPTATFVSRQPGGVIGEVLVFGLLGTLWSVRYALRR